MTFRRLLESNDLESTLIDLGYGSPFKGNDGHTTWSKITSPSQQVLIDYPGGEWHYMVHGDIINVGSLTDNSLKQYLSTV